MQAENSIIHKKQVPSYDIIYQNNKTSDWCVIIPVLNEGERIFSVLQKMKTLNTSASADIYIIDGGSTDHSMNSDRLMSLKVHGLLLKTGEGKLSAQLRCAYDFCLDCQYKGIITIDGNDKDDPIDIPKFIAALEDGVDFVQGSRFITGGAGINTPMSRALAIKLIHAPLLSLFSGFSWTDTTQGFRAYSAKFLIDDRVQPFREVFYSYELLAYLSYRAPKLGYTCREVPTTRIYPKGEVPTKIAGFKGNIELIMILISACFGAYNP